MVKKIFAYAWSVKREFTKYFIVGISGVVIDMATLIFFKEVWGIIPVLAVVLNQILMLTYNFTLNKYWSFRNKAMPHKQLVRYLMLAAFNYGFAVLTMYIFNQLWNFDYRIVRIATIAVMVGWNFFLYKYWIYGDEGKGERGKGKEFDTSS